MNSVIMNMKWKKWLSNPDVVGWVLWGGLTIVLFWPLLYLTRRLTYDSTTPLPTRIFMALFVSAIVSGIITWAVNETWYRVRLRRMARKNRQKGTKKKGR